MESGELNAVGVIDVGGVVCPNSDPTY